MRIKTQFLLSIVIFSVLLIIIGTLVITTQSQVASLSAEENCARRIQTGASDLSYIANSYFLYQDNSSIILWQEKVASLSAELNELNSTNAIQQSYVNVVKSDLNSLNDVFSGVIDFLSNAPRNESVRILPGFQTQWNRISVQTQALSFDSQQLSQTIGDQADQANLLNTLAIFALMLTFGAFFILIYFLNFNRTLKSIDRLKAGIGVIGSGNLDYTVVAGNKDEVSDISKSVNQMVTNLKTVTASKIDLEKEVEERKIVEEALLSNQKRFELLSTITSALLSNSQPKDVLNRICYETMKFLECDVFFNFLIDKQEAKLHLNAYFGVPPETAKTIEWLSFGEAVCGCAAQAGERIICENIPDTQDPRTALVHSFGVKAYCANPIFSDGKVIGTLSFGSKNKLSFSEDELSLMKTVTSQVSVAMARKEAEEALQDRTEQLERTQKKLEENACILEEYSNQMEELAKQRLSQLKDAERLAAIGATAGMVGHDIRNPLQAIVTDLYFVKKDLNKLSPSAEKDDIKESMLAIESSVGYINKIVQDLQDYARPITLVFQEVNLHSFADEVFRAITIPSNVTTDVLIDDNAGKLLFDPLGL